MRGPDEWRRGGRAAHRRARRVQQAGRAVRQRRRPPAEADETQEVQVRGARTLQAQLQEAAQVAVRRDLLKMWKFHLRRH